MQQMQHVVIVGGGVMGACTAYYLSKYESCRVTLIEKTDIACAASGKSGGFLALDWNDGTEGLKELSRTSYKLHQELAKELDGPNTYGYRPVTTYSIVFDTNRKTARESSREVDWINTQTVRSFEQIGTFETTSQLHPELFVHKLIEEAETTGRVKVRVGLGVSELLYDDSDEVVGISLSNGGKLYADKVIICMGPWSGKLDIRNQPNIPVEGSHVHSIVLKPTQTLPNHAIFTAILENSKPSEPEVYPRPDGTVYICGALDKEPLPESASLVAVNPKSIESLIHQASCISPYLSVEKAQVLKAQACYLPLSVETSLPLIGPHAHYKGLYLATGHSFWGILNAPITGKLISELVISNSVQSLDKDAYKYFLP